MSFNLSPQGITQSPLLSHGWGQVKPGPFFLRKLISSDSPSSPFLFCCASEEMQTRQSWKVLGNLHRLDRTLRQHNADQSTDSAEEGRGASHGAGVLPAFGSHFLLLSLSVLPFLSASSVFSQSSHPLACFALCFFQILLDSLEHCILHQPLAEPYQFQHHQAHLHSYHLHSTTEKRSLRSYCHRNSACRGQLVQLVTKSKAFNLVDWIYKFKNTGLAFHFATCRLPVPEDFRLKSSSLAPV